MTITLKAPGQLFVDGIRISPARSLKYRNHSPDGFGWGYGGSGPSQLALAILLELTDDPQFAQKHYQDFKFEFIATLADPGEEYELDEEAVSDFVQIRFEKDQGGI